MTFQEHIEKLKSEQANDPVIMAAGGLVWRLIENKPRLALIHRDRYNDWTFPKGKLESGESWQIAAIREVEEETGCKPQIISYAGATSYPVNSVAKIVLFWHMFTESESKFTPNEEVDEIRWVKFGKARKLLTYQTERNLLMHQKSFYDELKKNISSESN